MATAGCIVAGLLLLRQVRSRIDTVRRPLVLIATGSVNDYTAYLAIGAVAICAAMLW